MTIGQPHPYPLDAMQDLHAELHGDDRNSKAQLKKVRKETGKVKKGKGKKGQWMKRSPNLVAIVNTPRLEEVGPEPAAHKSLLDVSGAWSDVYRSPNKIAESTCRSQAPGAGTHKSHWKRIQMRRSWKSEVGTNAGEGQDPNAMNVEGI
ncbi:hypothetical protein DFH11DRAFT_1545124 [Phellopilus nigrolimitatus]|nr:hypothetical protein DFH11DRAFT_1545124 [Phellopilus nigrolimitatus]